MELIRTHRHDQLPVGYTPDDTMSQEFPFGEEMGFSLGEAGQRWRFLKGNDFYMTWMGPKLGAAVIVDTTETGYGQTGLHAGLSEHGAQFFKSLESRRLYSDDIVLVMPHTYRTEGIFRGYAKWVHVGRPPQFPLELWGPIAEGDPTAPLDPGAYPCPIPVRADFKVTGLVQEGQWQDPSALEAARSLLQARYDLKIGIWDLVENATLRRTLLEAVPPTSPPTIAVAIPRAASQRAESRVVEKMTEAAGEKQARRVVAEQLHLIEHGWKPGPGGSWSVWPEEYPVLLLHLELTIWKRQCTVSALTGLPNQVGIEEYIQAHRAIFERIAAPDACSPPMLWRGTGGWADDVDWGERAVALLERTRLWLEAFEELCDDRRRVLYGKYGI